jgi:xylulose-5-phosphate/fructose-6-phosphate phosphoketolase
MTDEPTLSEEAQAERDSEAKLSPELLAKMNAYWRAANYLSVGQI